MIRKTSWPSTTRYTLPIYMGYVLAEPKGANSSKMAESVKLSHDSINRFLLREAYESSDLFEEARGFIRLEGDTLSVDDSVLDKAL